MIADEKTTLTNASEQSNSEYTVEKLIQALEILEQNENPNSVKEEVDKLYYKLKKLDDTKFDSEQTALRTHFIERYNKFYTTLSEPDHTEIENTNKYKIKSDIIDKIQELSQGLKGIKATTSAYRKLKSDYKSITLADSNQTKELDQKLHLAEVQYHNYIKLTNDLKEVSFKKNQELKEELIAKAEELAELDPIKAFNKLQDLHEKWKSIGPAKEEVTEVLWTTFSDISKKINLEHRDFYLKIKSEQKNNLDKKLIVCEKLEEIAKAELEDYKQWNELTNQVLNYQKEWKNIGPVKKTKDKKIYKRYRKACDDFFENKQKFFEKNSLDFKENIEKKEALIAQAKELSTSTEWEETSKKLIKLSADWKKVGFVPFKKSKELWKEFKEACDTFFDNKRNKNTVSVEQQNENLELKTKLIEKIESFNSAEANTEDTKQFISESSSQWSSIGFVPKANKDEIQNRFNSAIDKLYQTIDLPKEEKLLLRFTLKVQAILGETDSRQKLVNEEFSIRNSISKLVSKIQTYKGNISFIQGSSEESEKIKKEINTKIEADQTQLEVLKTKLTILNKAKNKKL